MARTLFDFVLTRCHILGISLTEVSRRTGISRQTLYDLKSIPHKTPNLTTLINLADVIEVHPLCLLQFIFDANEINLESEKNLDRSAFIRDLNYPDGALVFSRQKFEKIWEIQNLGNQIWENRFLQCQDEEICAYTRLGEQLEIAPNLIPSQTRVAVPPTKPNEIARIAVNFTAPDTTGSVLSYWKMVFADGTSCFPAALGLWCKLRIITPTSLALNTFNDNYAG